MIETPDLPHRDLLVRQSEPIAGLRSRLLRRLGIARCRRVLDLGAGPDIVTSELRRRAAGPVIALDRRREALAAIALPAVVGDALALPFAARVFDLVFAQHLFMWVKDLAAAVREVTRVLTPDGHLLAIEPDFGAAIEHPPEIALAPIAIAALRRAGADPLCGRRLASALGAAGWQVQVDLLAQIAPVETDRSAWLSGLPLDDTERAAAGAAQRCAEKAPPGARLVHVPYLFVTARQGG